MVCDFDDGDIDEGIDSEGGSDISPNGQSLKNFASRPSRFLVESEEEDELLVDLTLIRHNKIEDKKKNYLLRAESCMNQGDSGMRHSQIVMVEKSI